MLLKQTIPFKSLPELLLKSIVTLSRNVCFEKGQIIFDVGAKAEDLYVLVLGEVELTFAQYSDLANLNRVLRSGAVFGWDTLFKNKSSELSCRLAKALVRDDAELMAINADDLESLFDADYVSYRVMMGRLVTMIAHESSMPGVWVGVDD